MQRELAASLADRGPSPEGVDEQALERTRRSLESKRRGVAGHLLPRLRTALGTAWTERFHEHAGRYIPNGLLHHVDDAWELAEALRNASEPEIRNAAQADLTALRLRYVRNPKAGGDRIRERRGFLVALVRSPGLALVVRLPGSPGRVWTFRLWQGESSPRWGDSLTRYGDSPTQGGDSSTRDGGSQPRGDDSPTRGGDSLTRSGESPTRHGDSSTRDGAPLTRDGEFADLTR